MTNRFATLSVLAALLLGGTGAALAQNYDRGGPDRGGQRDQQQWDRRGGGPGGPGGPQYNRPGPRGPDMRDDRRGPSYGPAYYRGGRLPGEYRNRQYVVDDWRGHRLHQPPRGYHWVQASGGDYLLVAITTGIIAQILTNQ
ncbi:RcnB family protein [Xylophilus sp. GW821-FHT01B05]